MLWSEFIENLSKLVICIKWHGGQFNIITHDFIKGDKRDTCSELTVWYLHMYVLDDMSANSSYDLSINGLYALSSNSCPCDVRVLQEFFITGLKIPSVNACSHDVRDYVDVTSEIVLPGMNGLGP